MARCPTCRNDYWIPQAITIYEDVGIGIARRSIPSTKYVAICDTCNIELVPRQFVAQDRTNPNPQLVFARNKNIRFGIKSNDKKQEKSKIWCVKISDSHVTQVIEHIININILPENSMVDIEADSALIEATGREQALELSKSLNKMGYRSSVETKEIRENEVYLLQVRSFGDRIKEVEQILTIFNLEEISQIFETKVILVDRNEVAKSLYTELIKVGVKLLPPQMQHD